MSAITCNCNYLNVQSMSYSLDFENIHNDFKHNEHD